MLSEIQKTRFTERAKNEAKKLLADLNISKLDDDSLCKFERTLDVYVSGLVTLQECENKPIDEELLRIYDLLTDIVLDNEEDLDFLNHLFFD